MNVGLGEVYVLWWHVIQFADEAAHGIDGQFAVFFAQGVVVKAIKHNALFDVRTQMVVKIVLRAMVYHPIAT